MSYSTIIVRKEDGIATITLNRPPFNPLNTQVFKELGLAVTELEVDPDVRVVVITGAGEKAFAAGADINEMKNLTPLEMYHFCRNSTHTYTLIENMSKPTIAALNGLTLGGGCELALTCDLRVAAQTARIALPEINLGIIPGGGAPQRLPRLIGTGRAKELMFLGELIDAGQAEKYGLVNKVVPATKLMQEAIELAGKMIRKPPLALALLKEVIHTGLNTDLASAIEYGVKSFVVVFSSEDRVEGFNAFTEKRQPNFLGK
ncbi:enoyl-CoA hydratase [Clostridiales bacterium PH28_bin88]|nr:enoyl-CoA hydratase [Clostridiales bacterium PH28_bin88]